MYRFLEEYRQLHKMREDWHEPDEEEISAEVKGKCLDNAFGEATDSGELVVILACGCPDERPIVLNLANLLADYCRLIRETQSIAARQHPTTWGKER